MLRLFERGKAAANRVARLFGARLVGSEWGPRGASAALARAKSQGFNPGSIFDIGASNGQWTRECRTIFPDARYFLADPLPENRTALQTMAQSDARISIWNGAIGAEAGQLELHCHGDQSSFLPSNDFKGPPRAVEVRTLDSFFDASTFNAPCLIKADVQGFELEVLRGATRCLEQTEMLLLELTFRRYYERGALAHEVIAFAGERHFRVYDICTYIQRPADNELIHADLIFAREGSVLFAHEGWH